MWCLCLLLSSAGALAPIGEAVGRARAFAETVRIVVETRVATDIAIIKTAIEYARMRAREDTTRLLTAARDVQNMSLAELVVVSPFREQLLQGAARRKQWSPLDTIAASDAIADVAYVARRRSQGAVLALPGRNLQLMPEEVITVEADVEEVKTEPPFALVAVSFALLSAEQLATRGFPMLGELAFRVGERAAAGLGFVSSKATLLNGLEAKPTKKTEITERPALARPVEEDLDDLKTTTLDVLETTIIDDRTTFDAQTPTSRPDDNSRIVAPEYTQATLIDVTPTDVDELSAR